MLWTLARDDATPFPNFFGKISPTYRNQFNATLSCGIFSTVLGLIYIGSGAAFSAFVGVFAILTTMSYLAAILPHILLSRQHVKPGPFWMPGIVGYLVMGAACGYIIVFNIIYMFPFALPVDAAHMNYSCLMAGGLTIFITIWYYWKRNRGYVGPHVLLEANNDIVKGLIE
jgi:choline transport protein